MITAENVNELFIYCPNTGTLKWRVYVSPQVPAGSVVGQIKEGYRTLRYKRRQYSAHRVIWLMLKGRWPEHQIDHINGVRDDNRACNLRECSSMQNAWNKGAMPFNTTGFKGVSKSGKSSVKPYRADIKIAGFCMCIGRFATAEEASAAYQAVALVAFGQFHRMENAA